MIKPKQSVSTNTHRQQGTPIDLNGVTFHSDSTFAIQLPHYIAEKRWLFSRESAPDGQLNHYFPYRMQNLRHSIWEMLGIQLENELHL